MIYLIFAIEMRLTTMLELVVVMLIQLELVEEKLLLVEPMVFMIVP